MYKPSSNQFIGRHHEEEAAEKDRGLTDFRVYITVVMYFSYFGSVVR